MSQSSNPKPPRPNIVTKTPKKLRQQRTKRIFTTYDILLDLDEPRILKVVKLNPILRRTKKVICNEEESWMVGSLELCNNGNKDDHDSENQQSTQSTPSYTDDYFSDTHNVSPGKFPLNFKRTPPSSLYNENHFSNLYILELPPWRWFPTHFPRPFTFTENRNRLWHSCWLSLFDANHKHLNDDVKHRVNLSESFADILKYGCVHDKDVYRDTIIYKLKSGGVIGLGYDSLKNEHDEFWRCEEFRVDELKKTIYSVNNELRNDDELRYPQTVNSNEYCNFLNSLTELVDEVLTAEQFNSDVSGGSVDDNNNADGTLQNNYGTYKKQISNDENGVNLDLDLDSIINTVINNSGYDEQSNDFDAADLVGIIKGVINGVEHFKNDSATTAINSPSETSELGESKDEI